MQYCNSWSRFFWLATARAGRLQCNEPLGHGVCTYTQPNTIKQPDKIPTPKQLRSFMLQLVCFALCSSSSCTAGGTLSLCYSFRTPMPQWLVHPFGFPFLTMTPTAMFRINTQHETLSYGLPAQVTAVYQAAIRVLTLGS